jgi:hypothetical protein
MVRLSSWRVPRPDTNGLVLPQPEVLVPVAAPRFDDAGNLHDEQTRLAIRELLTAPQTECDSCEGARQSGVNQIDGGSSKSALKARQWSTAQSHLRLSLGNRICPLRMADLTFRAP